MRQAFLRADDRMKLFSTANRFAWSHSSLLSVPGVDGNREEMFFATNIHHKSCQSHKNSNSTFSCFHGVLRKLFIVESSAEESHRFISVAMK
jgi:hypothetical protein